jgi:hypothetical protein
MDSRRSARGGETALSPERMRGSSRAAKKEGVRGGTMGSPTRKRRSGLPCRERKEGADGGTMG